MTAIASKFPNPDVSKDEIQHFTDTFAALDAKLQDCSGFSKIANTTECPTGGAGVYPTAMVTSVPSNLPTGVYTPHPSPYTPFPTGSAIPTKVSNTTVATGKPNYVVTAGASGLKLSVGAVAIAAFVAFLL